MIKRAPTTGRLVGMALFAFSCFGVLLYLWLSFGGTEPLRAKGYRFHVHFPEAAHLATQADVRISGVPVGRVVALKRAPGNTTDATIEMRSRYSPVPLDVHAILRQKTLLGETYVELTPGTRRAGNMLPDGGTLAAARVAPTVQLDEIYRTFDQPTRRAFQAWIEAQAGAGDGRGPDLNAALGNLPAFTESTTRVLADLNGQQGAVRRLVHDTGVVFSALSERRGQLRELISASNQVFATTALRNRQLAETFTVLPTFEHESSATLRRLTAFADNASPLVDQLQPAAEQASPLLVGVRALAPDFESFFVRLGPLVSASRRGLPALESVLNDLRPVLGRLDPVLANVNPILDFLGSFRREITAFFANVTAATEASDQPPKARSRVHYLRTANPASPLSLAFYPRFLGFERSNPYTVPGAFDKLATGLKVFDGRGCGNGNPAPPASAIPDTLVPLIPRYVFRTNGRDVAAPPCVQQGTFPGFRTAFPRLLPSP
jgi:ABC-type transporter Mla subunit MlaD